MNQVAFFKARRLPAKFLINAYQEETFPISENGTAIDVTRYTWEFFIKKNPGSRVKIFSLTLGNGINFPAYTTDEVRVVVSAATSNIDEGEYYYELRRTDLIIPYLNGPATFYYGNVDSQ